MEIDAVKYIHLDTLTVQWIEKKISRHTAAIHYVCLHFFPLFDQIVYRKEAAAAVYIAQRLSVLLIDKSLQTSGTGIAK
jgi:hypothetical protein